MAKHHYIPVSIIRRFATAEAAYLIPNAPPGLIRTYSQMMLDPDKARKRPVCLYQKGRSPRPLRPAPAENVFYKSEFYQLPIYSDPIKRGLLWSNFSRALMYPIPRLRTITDLLQIAREPYDPEAVEKFISRRLDGPMARIISQLPKWSREDWDLAQRFLRLSFIRTEAWHTEHYRSFARNAVNSIRPTFAELDAVAKSDLGTTIFQHLDDVLLSNLYTLFIAEATKGDFDPLQTIHVSVTLLRAGKNVQFVLPDNPGRPWNRERIHDLTYRAMPGFKEYTTWLTYPIDPYYCLILRRGYVGCPNRRVINASDNLVRTINTALFILSKRDIVFPGPKYDWFLPRLHLERIPPWTEPKNR